MTQELEADRYKVDRIALSTFLIPLLCGGIVFSILANNYLNTLPKMIVTPYDRLYAIFLAFVDMGLACGIAALTILCFVRQVLGAVKRFRSRQGHLATEQ